MTRLLADENIPEKAVDILRHCNLDIASMADTSPGLSDKEVIEHA